MRTPRLYLPQPLTPDTIVTLDEKTAHYVVNVLRLKSGAPAIVFNGLGGEYAARLESVAKRGALLHVGAYIPRECEPPLRVVLAQGISRGERMDYTIQKSVELGIAEIVPLVTERCGVRLEGERSARRVDHWQAVVAGACEQSGRNRIPVVHEPCTLQSWLAAMDQQTQDTLKLVLAPEGETSLNQISKPGEVILLIGPEGGLSDNEIAQAGNHGFAATRLGPRILRTETAAVAALAAIFTLWGDLV
jgi:16S rRNA (uracil1498-N3)-methyltransferase